MKLKATDKREKAATVFLYAVFFVYIIFLLKLLFFSRITFGELFSSGRAVIRDYNFIPFKTVSGFLFTDSQAVSRFSFSNVAGNIMIFIPLGGFLPLLMRHKKIHIHLLVVFASSLAAELIQLIFGIGTCDIDDLILNTIGGIIGVFGYKLLTVIFRNEKNAKKIIVILSALSLPVLFYLLFFIRLNL